MYNFAAVKKPAEKKKEQALPQITVKTYVFPNGDRYGVYFVILINYNFYAIFQMISHVSLVYIS